MARSLARQLLTRPVTLDVDLDFNRLIDLKEVCVLLNIDKRTCHRWIKERKIPQPIRSLSPRRHKWRKKTILEFIRKLEAETLNNAS